MKTGNVTIGLIALGVLLLIITRFFDILHIPSFILIFLPLILFIFYFIRVFKDLVEEASIHSIIVNYVVVMLLLTIIFGFFYLTLADRGLGYLRFGMCDNSFEPGNPATIIVPEVSNNYYYFSIVTLFSLGYGDICPMGMWMRVISGAEIVVGNLFTVVIVALIIGNYLTKTKKPLKALRKRFH